MSLINGLGVILCIASFGTIAYVQYFEEDKSLAHYLTFIADLMLSLFLVLIDIPIMLALGLLISTIMIKSAVRIGSIYTQIGIGASIIYAFSSAFLVYVKAIPADLPVLSIFKLPFEKNREHYKEEKL